MTEDQKREIKERLTSAKKALSDAEKMAIQYGASKRLVNSFGKLAGETEYRQNSF